MAKRKKRIEKQIQGLEKIKEKHLEKLESEPGRKDTTHEYWIGEIEEFDRQIKEKIEKLKKIDKDKE